LISYEVAVSESFKIDLTSREVAIAHKALADYLSSLLREWQDQEDIKSETGPDDMYESVDEVRTLMNKIGALPLKLR
jgi:hypothetical protein